MAAVIEWKDQYKVGVDGVDAQHEELFALYNGLVAANDASDTTILSYAFEALVGYLDEHFSAEEELWRLDEALYREHRKLHSDFVKYVMRETAHGKNLDALENLLGFLSTWLLDHIQTVDKIHFQRLRDKGLL